MCYNVFQSCMLYNYVTKRIWLRVKKYAYCLKIAVKQAKKNLVWSTVLLNSGSQTFKMPSKVDHYRKSFCDTKLSNQYPFIQKLLLLCFNCIYWYTIHKNVLSTIQKQLLNISYGRTFTYLKIFSLLNKISVHSKIISVYTLGNTTVEDKFHYKTLLLWKVFGFHKYIFKTIENHQ